jgi:ferritin-like metal-binding protein YciE
MTSLLYSAGTWLTAGIFVSSMALTMNWSPGQDMAQVGVIQPAPQDKGLQDLFEMQLSLMYHMEERIGVNLGEQLPLARSLEVREAMEQHRKESAAQADRLNAIFGMMESRPGDVVPMALQGAFAENERLIGAFKGGVLVDHAILAGMRTVQHMEIAGYQNLIRTAELLDRKEDIVSLLKESLEEERPMDELLQKLAEAGPATRSEQERDLGEPAPRRIPQE